MCSLSTLAITISMLYISIGGKALTIVIIITIMKYAQSSQQNDFEIALYFL